MLKDFRTVWAGCLRTIAAEIGEQSFKTWFRPIVPIELKDNVLTIQVPHHGAAPKGGPAFFHSGLLPTRGLNAVVSAGVTWNVALASLPV